MANLKQIRKHIASVQNTGKITKAMKMVAVSKLRKSQTAVVATRPYVNALVNTIEHIILKSDETQHPLLRRPESMKKVALIVVSGDKGLCGAYNHNIVKSARKFVEANSKRSSSISSVARHTKRRAISKGSIARSSPMAGNAPFLRSLSSSRNRCANRSSKARSTKCLSCIRCLKARSSKASCSMPFCRCSRF